MLCLRILTGILNNVGKKHESWIGGLLMVAVVSEVHKTKFLIFSLKSIRVLLYLD